MIKKINKGITLETVKNLKGFEDVFEDYVISEDYKELERINREKSKAGEQYELQYFLEQENARLTAIEVFLTKKISIRTNFSQTEKLLKIQNDRKNLLKEKLLTEVKILNSTFQKNIAQFFNSHFG